MQQYGPVVARGRWLPFLIYWCHVCIPPVVRSEACVVGSLVDNSEDGCNAGCEGLGDPGSYTVGSGSFVHFEPLHHLLNSRCCDLNVSDERVWGVWHEVVWDVSYLVEYWLELSVEVHWPYPWDSFMDSFMSCLHSLLGYNLQGSSRLCNWLSLHRLVPWINHLPPVYWSTFGNLV